MFLVEKSFLHFSKNTFNYDEKNSLKHIFMLNYNIRSSC